MMRYLFLLTILIVIGSGGQVSAKDDYIAPSTVGIIGALELEIQLYLEEMEAFEETDIGGLKFYSGILDGQRVVIVRSGVGKVYAASAATLLIHEFDVNAVIFSGVAGGVDPDLSVGDIVIADQLHQHDLGTHTSDGFEWQENVFFPNELLSQVAYQAAKNTEFPTEMFEGFEIEPAIVRGTIVTGDQFIMSDDYVEFLFEKFNASCTEMEGASVAAVCQEFRVPYVVIRCLSDRADDVADVDFSVFAPYAARACSLIVLEMMGEVSGIQKDMLSRTAGIPFNSDVRTCRTA